MKPRPEAGSTEIRECWDRPGLAIIHDRHAVFGDRDIAVRKFSVSDAEPAGQYEHTVTVRYIKKHQQTSNDLQILPTNMRYVTIEKDGAIIYDSRTDVPCDMAQWRAYRQPHHSRLMASRMVK
jgi:hypothetical protein